MPQISPLVAGDPTELGSFRLSGRVGEGGQGIVYLGVDDKGERAAIKLLHVKFSGDTIARSRFARELKAAQRVASFCTARVMEADLDGDTPYIASEYIDGRPLREIIEEDGPLTGTVLDRLAIGTATALTAIHHASIVHRDFKPDNVLIAADGPRVVDFGIARIIDSTGTITSRAIGTPAYMAPEQIAGDDIGPYTDVFSWGATIAFAASGEVAFEGKSIAMVLNRILNHEVDVGMMHEPLQSVVRSALSKSPAERPSADQILLRLLGQASTVGASTAVLTRGVQVASDDTTPFTRVSAGSITEQPGRTGAAPSQTGGTGQPSQTGGGAAPSAQTGGGAAPSAQTGGGAAPSSMSGGPVPHAQARGGLSQLTTHGSMAQQEHHTTGQQTGSSIPHTGPSAQAGPQAGAGAPYAGPAPQEGGGPPYPMGEPAGPERSRRARVWLAVLTAVALLAAAAIALFVNGWSPLAFTGDTTPDRTSGRGPGTGLSSVVDKVAETGKIVIGVKGDLPGVGLQNGDAFQGFDVEIAKRLATGLGAKETTFVRVGRDDRASSLAEGETDLIVATYSIDKSQTQFAGPYYLAHQDLLVRAGAGIDEIGDLKGKRICAPNSPSVGAVQDRVKVQPVVTSDYAACMDLLRSGKVDAVPGDDLILAGFAARENMRYKILGAKLTNERYAVGIRDGDVKTCKAVKAVIADLYAKGVVEQLLTSHFGKVDFKAELKVPAMETC
ncbi:transporter substrate-binding domain-containing protein [Nonomuraea fuscirosea]|uniref:serine/threonine-protein kinase n=1 Tax=Nonomuraea fuscirosea TaxID=1291556 RepID=UPI002DDBCAB8|nr:transporter substrate-binding domain-containing protein [Nonomuraea fuscirosea]WSA50476.1 transporter substrate-binding domain-containing protein [Nonomuraea fuscirosea]